jgi:NADPH2:quinone reductase
MTDHYEAMSFDRFGPPGEVLRRRRLDRRSLAPDEVRLGVRAVGLNFLDATFCRGRYPVRPAFPATPGVEVAGVVVETGADALSWAGREVVACPTLPEGALGEEVVVAASLLVERPSGIPPEVAAAMPVTYQTAWFALERARVRAGETVLVTAGAGGVGTAATQLARLRGATVVTVVGGAEKAALSRAQGADAVIDRFDGDVIDGVRAEVDGVDVIIDPVGGALADRLIELLRFEGRYVAIGQAGGPVAFDTVRLMGANVDLIGLSWGSAYPFRRPELVHEVAATLFAAVVDGDISPVISRVIGLDEVPEALDELEAGRTIGKLVARVERGIAGGTA